MKIILNQFRLATYFWILSTCKERRFFCNTIKQLPYNNTRTPPKVPSDVLNKKIYVMKTLILLLIITLEVMGHNAMDTISLKTKLTDVTVFFSGAQITRKAEL